MNYHNITVGDMLNGEGLRVVLWVAGCNHNCKGCQNPITHNPKGGILFDNDAYSELMEALTEPYIKGITFSGGDPLFPDNRNTIEDLCRKIRVKFGKTKDIWLYTGYRYEDVKDLPLMQYIDILVDGKFVEKLADVNYHWAGSTNQRVINIKKIREEKRKERKERKI